MLAPTADELRRRVLHLDPDVLVLDKPAGLPVHYGARVERHLEELLPALALGLPEPPRLAHRLDRDTSGCLVLGRHPAASAALGRLFLRGRVEKVYWAVCEGIPAAPGGRIDLPLRKRPGPAGARMEIDEDGKPAVTDWRLVAAASGRSWVELRPRTGRTHQLRAHLRALGTPIVGDRTYGEAPAGPLPLHLHARAVRFPWPPGAPVAAVAPLPAHMAETFGRLGFAAGAAGDPFAPAPT